MTLDPGWMRLLVGGGTSACELCTVNFLFSQQRSGRDEQCRRAIFITLTPYHTYFSPRMIFALSRCLYKNRSDKSLPFNKMH